MAILMIPDWSALTAAAGAWMMLAVKILTAMGFMAAANMVILYAS